MPKINRTTVIALSAALIAVNVFVGVRLCVIAGRRIEMKEDSARVNSFKFGVLSVDFWKNAIRDIVGKKIEGFEFSAEQEVVLKYELTKVLRALLSTTALVTQDPRTGIAGGIQRSLIKSFLGVARKNVSRYAQTVIDEIKQGITLLRRHL